VQWTSTRLLARVVDQGDLRLQYSARVWAGQWADLDEIARAAKSGNATSASALSPPAASTVALYVIDTAAPEPLALPRYQGQLYVYAALAMAGLAVVALVPLLLFWILIAVRGLPRTRSGKNDIMPALGKDVLVLDIDHRDGQLILGGCLSSHVV